MRFAFWTALQLILGVLFWSLTGLYQYLAWFAFMFTVYLFVDENYKRRYK